MGSNLGWRHTLCWVACIEGIEGNEEGANITKGQGRGSFWWYWAGRGGGCGDVQGHPKAAS